jgi:hypothetical protein
MSAMQTIIIDLNTKNLTEGAATVFKRQMNSLLLSMYAAGFEPQTNIKGTAAQIEAFFKALKGEKRYMDSYMKHGLGDSRTMSNKRQLDRAVGNFERETSLRWPFKN